MSTVVFNGVTKRYGEVLAVDALNLEIRDGEFMVLVGPSGCGKTTSLRMIAGLEEISSGELSIGNRVVNNVAPKDRDIAMVFQSYALYPHMTVKENMAFGLKLRKTAKAEIDRRVNEAAAILDLAALLERKPKELSGGQRQRVALGRAIVREPSVFLMDEPLSNLDAKLRVQTRAEIVRLHARLKATVVYVTHDQVEAMTMSDRVAVFSTGALRQVDEPRRLYEAPASLFVARFLGESNALPATVRQHDGGSCAAALATGETVTAVMPVPCAPGSAVHLVVRPEKILLGKAAQASPNRFAARIAEVTFLGDQTRLRLVAFGADDFIVKLANTAGQETFAPGTEIDIGWQAEDCRALAE